MSNYSASEQMIINSFGDFLRTVEEVSNDQTVEIPLSKILVAQILISAASEENKEFNEVLKSAGIAESSNEVLSPYLTEAMDGIDPEDEDGMKLAKAFASFFMKMMLASVMGGVLDG